VKNEAQHIVSASQKLPHAGIALNAVSLDRLSYPRRGFAPEEGFRHQLHDDALRPRIHSQRLGKPDLSTDPILIAPPHSGMLSCFFHGIFGFLLRRHRKGPAHPHPRAERGMITSSMNPRSAATNGLANRSS
jgi:hypothetical protein